MRFLFVDRILELEHGKRILTTKTFTMTDPYVDSYYPLRPTVPATLLVESLAQAGGWLNWITRDYGVITLLVLVEGVRLYRRIEFGETLLIDMQMVYAHSDGITLRGSVRVGEDTVAVIDRMVMACEPRDDLRFREERMNLLRNLNPALVPAEELSA